MQIRIIAVGKIKEKYLREGIQDYKQRLSKYAKVDIIELTDEKTPDGASPATEENIRQIEGKRILDQIRVDEHCLVLDIAGTSLSSTDLADRLDSLATYGKSKLAIIIGGSLGLSDEILARADERISFSAMTFPHQLMRLILLEQIYRAYKINRNEPYHK